MGMYDKEDRELPIDTLYDEGLPVGDILFEEMTRSNEAWKDIDWDTDVSNDDAVLDLTAHVTTQSHYMKTAHLLLCGKIIQYQTARSELDVTQLAMVLTAFKLESIHAWGRYLGEVNRTSKVSSQMKRYLRKLFSDEDTYSLLIGMEIVAGPLMREIYSALQLESDRLYAQIAGNLVNRKDQETEYITDYLKPRINEMNRQERQELRTDAEQYRNLAENIVLSEEGLYATAGIDIDEIRESLHDATDAFLDDIGL